LRPSSKIKRKSSPSISGTYKIKNLPNKVILFRENDNSERNDIHKNNIRKDGFSGNSTVDNYQQIYSQ